MSRKTRRKDYKPGVDNSCLIHDGSAADDPALALVREIADGHYKRPKKASLDDSIVEWWGHEVASAVVRHDAPFFRRLADYVNELKDDSEGLTPADPLASAIASDYRFMVRCLHAPPTRNQLYLLLLNRDAYRAHEKQDFRRQVDEVARKLGLKFVGKRGRPKK